MKTLTGILASLAMSFSLLVTHTAGAEVVFFSVCCSVGGELFPGEVNKPGFEGKIQAVEYDSAFINNWKRGANLNKLKQAKRHRPIKLTKIIGAASPLLYKAHNKGKALTFIIDFVSPSRSGEEISGHRMILKHAIIAKLDINADEVGTAEEEFTISFQYLDFKELPSGSYPPPNLKRPFRG